MSQALRKIVVNQKYEFVLQHMNISNDYNIMFETFLPISEQLLLLL